VSLAHASSLERTPEPLWAVVQARQQKNQTLAHFAVAGTWFAAYP